MTMHPKEPPVAADKAPAFKELPPLEVLRRFLAIDATSPSGLVWRVARGTKPRGAPAGYLNKRGRYALMVNKSEYFAHRIVWSLANDALISPWLEIDHENGIPSDNRPENLRPCTHAQNGQNTAPLPNRTGFPGVYQDGPRWSSKIKVNSKKIWLGAFDTPEAAHAAYVAAKAKHHTFSPKARSA